MKLSSIGQTNSGSEDTNTVKIFVSKQGVSYIGFRYSDTNKQLMIINETEKLLKLNNFLLEKEVLNLQEVVNICDSINEANESKISAKDNVINAQGFYIAGQEVEVKKLKETLNKEKHKKKSILLISIPTIIISFFAGATLMN